MTVRTAQVAIALAMVIATSHQSLAEPTCAEDAGCFKKGTRPHTVRKYYNYAPLRAKQPRDDPYDDPQVKAIWEEAIGQ